MFPEKLGNVRLTSGDGKEDYLLTKIDNIDMSASFEKEKGTVVITHLLQGFEYPMYVMVNKEDEIFTLAKEEENEPGTLTAVTDKEIVAEGMKVVQMMYDSVEVAKNQSKH
ncbi:hypothetical protein [Bacillus mycoides]|uniref:hypothetical protein n=1 Tax=Bacillus mycoides TaxID=1405 RepID=UPI003A7FC1A2